MIHIKQLIASLLLIVLVLCGSEYKVVNQSRTTTSVTLILDYFGSAAYYLKPTSPMVKKLNFTLTVLSFQDFVFTITDTAKQRFTVPQGGFFPTDPFRNFSFPLASSAITFEYTANPFDFKILRKEGGSVLFSTYNRTLVYSDYFIQIGTQLETRFLFGLGERLAQSFAVRQGRWSMFGHDFGGIIDPGVGWSTYGYYPFYLMKERNKLFHVCHFRTSSPMDAVTQLKDNNTHFITFKAIGGIIDFRFFVGDADPESVVERFNFYNGRADIPPFWSFGYHQCRWGYADIGALRTVISKFQSLDIPLDTVWSDLDYMIDSEVFTIDEKKFPPAEMKELLKQYRWVPIIDPGIKNSGKLYEEGLKRNAFILDANSKQPFLGKMRAGRTVYPDFFHPNASQYWSYLLDNLYQKVPFSGIWLDSNEFTSFCQGRCEPPTTPSIFDYNNDLPHQPGIIPIEQSVISLNSTHYGNLVEADVHIYNGYIQCYETYNYLQSKGVKPFILTRSSTFGSSKYAIHWTGDNSATWLFLRTSISDNFNNQLWGSQFIGADMCGFALNTTDELCARWYQLGSFYPFSRNHNKRGLIDQQPYALGPLTLESAQLNLKMRYGLLKYFFTLFIAKNGLGTIWKPLFFVFPNDTSSYDDNLLQTEFLFGPDLLFVPLLEEGKIKRQAYLPQVNWYDFHTGTFFKAGIHTLQNKPNELTPIFIKQGTIIFYQETVKITKTKQLLNRFTFYLGMKYDSQKSNSTTKIYTAIGSILSLQDYNQDSLVDECKKSGCLYEIRATLAIGSSKTMQLAVKYAGGSNLNQEIVIEKANIYYNNDKIIYPFQQPIKVTGTANFSIMLPSKSLVAELQ